jgi:hypothetical protein
LPAGRFDTNRSQIERNLSRDAIVFLPTLNKIKKRGTMPPSNISPESEFGLSARAGN